MNVVDAGREETPAGEGLAVGSSKIDVWGRPPRRLGHPIRAVPSGGARGMSLSRGCVPKMDLFGVVIMVT
jgi:hypothetical protein